MANNATTLLDPAGANGRWAWSRRRPPEVTFEITDMPIRNIDVDDPDDTTIRDTRALIWEYNTFLETYLNIHYKVGVCTFRIEKNGQIFSCWYRKVK